MINRAMRLLVMFDLPVETSLEKKEYTRFRKALIRSGFLMMQYSIYVRCCLNQDNATKYLKQVEMFLPKHGAVRCLMITEKQFGKMKILLGEKSINEDLLKDKRMVVL